MPVVKVIVEDIEDLKLTTKTIHVKDEEPRHMIQVSFMTQLSPVSVARILHQLYAGHPIDVTISLPQAIFDLAVEQVVVKTGEIAETQ